MTGSVILVTGAAGLIGGRLARRLVAEGAAVIATDRQVVEAPPGVRWETVDLMDSLALVTLMREARVGAVVHSGAISGPMVAAGDPHKVVSVNVIGTLNVAEAALGTGVDRLVALSSAGVYGAQSTPDPVREDAPSMLRTSTARARSPPRRFFALTGTTTACQRLRCGLRPSTGRGGPMPAS